MFCSILYAWILRTLHPPPITRPRESLALRYLHKTRIAGMPLWSVTATYSLSKICKNLLGVCYVNLECDWVPNLAWSLVELLFIVRIRFLSMSLDHIVFIPIPIFENLKTRSLEQIFLKIWHNILCSLYFDRHAAYSVLDIHSGFFFGSNVQQSRCLGHLGGGPYAT